MNHLTLRGSTYSIVATLIVAASVLVGSAQGADKSKEKVPPLRGNDCLFFSAVYDWQELDQDNLVIWGSGHRDAFHVYLTTPLYSLNFSTKLAFVDRDRDGMLCGFSRDEIAIDDHTFPQHSSISAMKKLDAEGIAKLEQQFKTKISYSKKQKPKEPARESAT